MAQTVREGKRNKTKLAFDEIREEPIQVQEGNGNLNDAICDVCLIRTFSSVDVNIALYVCYICNKYLCHDCFKGHKSHILFEKGEKERMKKCFRDEIMNEKKEMLDKEDVSLADRVNVEHELDKHEKCWITGLCGLDDTRWVVCDSYNDCIKVFSIGSHLLQRYIRFGSKPSGVTAINNERKKVKPLKRFLNAIKTFVSIKRQSAEKGILPTTSISVTNQSKPDKQCLLAVLLSRERRILLIDLTQHPAVITKSIKTKKYCHAMEFSGDHIITVCSDEFRGYGPSFISVLSTGGVALKNTPLDLQYIPHLAVCSGRFYLTDYINDKVLCINDEGKVVSHKTIEGSRPLGISVDPDTSNVYMCADGNNRTLYRLDSRFESFESLFEFKWKNSGSPKNLCVYRDRLYVSHGPGSTMPSLVNVYTLT